MIKELEEVRQALVDASIAHNMSHTSFCDESYWKDEFAQLHRKALTTIDSILNQDEAELVERVAVAIQSAYKRSINYDLSKEAIMTIINDGTPIGAAKDALRAVGLMKEGE